VVLSTASIERVTVFDLLLAYKGKMTTSQIANSLNISNHTAHRTMTELKALGLVDMTKESEANNSEYQITLDPKFDWFLTKEFLQLREGFIPSDNSEYLNKGNGKTTTDIEKELEEKYPSSNDQISDVKGQLEEKIPLSSQENNDSDSITVVKNNDGIMEKEELEEKNTLTSTNYDPCKLEEKIINITQKINSGSSEDNNIQQQIEKENSEVIGGNFSSSSIGDYIDKEPVFWDVFNELSNDNNGRLVDYENLRLRLISTGKFFAGDAVMMIEHTERTGKIEETGFHFYRRKVPHNGDGNKL
jgi:hypothetical protein